MPGRRSSSGRRRSRRSPSATSTLQPESSRPNASSSPVHQALRGTTTAPAAAAAQNASAHSGKLRMAMATRSPFRTPSRSTSDPASAAEVR